MSNYLFIPETLGKYIKSFVITQEEKIEKETELKFIVPSKEKFNDILYEKKVLEIMGVYDKNNR
jgi:hypothetical protein